jgi:hypothetical protein
MTDDEFQNMKPAECSTASAEGSGIKPLHPDGRLVIGPLTFLRPSSFELRNSDSIAARLLHWFMPVLVATCGLLLSTGCRTVPPRPPDAAPGRFTLKPSAFWQVELPDKLPFDTSALLRLPDGELWTLNDKDAALFRLRAPAGGGAATLTRLPQFFRPGQLAPFAAEKKDRYDVEGLARDDQGRIYVSEEANRWILRFSPDGSKMERLPIDWSSVARFFDPKDGNASFEGVAVIGNTLYVANERSLPRIIKVDLGTMKVTGDFCPTFNIPLINEAHLGDLAAWRGHLFVLIRSRAQVLEIDPATERVVATYVVAFAESDPEFAYISRYGTGNLEGLAIDEGGFWMVTDNNGLGRKKYPQDIRPTLFRCPWPVGAGR